MELRTAFTITLASVTAALTVVACEPEPRFCAPKVAQSGPEPAGNPECTACIADHCGDAGDDCGSECEAYGSCTCACDESDVSCFETCSQERTEGCTSCQESSSNAQLACVMDKCQVCGVPGGSGSGSGEDGGADSNADDGGWSESGGDSWSDSGAWTDTGGWSESGGSWGESGDSWSDTGAWTDTGDSASSFTDDGGSGGGAVCEQLHAECCPNLDGYDLELCEDATDESSCQLWLDVFQEQGAC
jgi:hypothetical protein